MSDIIDFDAATFEELNSQLLDLAINHRPDCRDVILNSLQLLSHLQYCCRNQPLPHSVMLICQQQTVFIKWSTDKFILLINVYDIARPEHNAYYTYHVHGQSDYSASFSTSDLPPDQLIRAFS